MARTSEHYSDHWSSGWCKTWVVFILRLSCYVILCFQTVNMATELRKPVYWSVSSRVINYDIILQYMASVKWDIKDIMSQHNSYIDAILKVSQ